MASRRLVFSLRQSSTQFSITNPRPRLSSSTVSGCPSPYGYLLNRITEYATSAAATAAPAPPAKKDAGTGGGKIVDEFTGKGAIGQTWIFPQTVALSRVESKNGLASILGDSRSSLFHQAAALALHFPSRLMSTQKSSFESSQDSSTPVSEVPPRIKFKRLDKTAKHIMQIIDKEAVEEVRTHREIPDIQPGYIVQLKVEVPENKRRASIIKGIVIARRNAGLNTTFRIRRLVAGIGIESLFPLYSPNIKEIEVLEKKRVRRAKLYYLREKMDALKKQ